MMLSRFVRVARFGASARNLSLFINRLINDPKVKEKMTAMAQDPEAISKGLATITASLKGGGGMTGMLIRNSPIKGMVEKIGGVETLERTVKDPETMEMFQEMLKDPEFMAEMSKSIAKELGEFMKTDDKLPGKK